MPPRIAFHEYELRLRDPWEISRGAATSKRNAFVQITHHGITGEGEAAFHGHFGETPATVHADLTRAAATLTSTDLDALDPLLLTGASRTALEMALLDWQSKRADLPLHRFLDLPASLHPILTSFSIGIDTPERMHEKALAAADFHSIKIKLGTPADRDRFEAVRAATTAPIRIDANGGWETREHALKMIEWLAEQRGVELIEQPLPSGRLDDHAWLTERSPLPIILDEDARTAADIPALAGKCHGINIKLMKTGGLLEAVAMANVARHHDLKIMLGCMIESSLAIAAALHLAPLADWIDLDGHLLVANDPYQGITLHHGHLLLPAGPGIGVHRIPQP